jgi:mRNA interferase MazF
MVIQQGEFYWIDMGDPTGSAPGYKHSHVVIQNKFSIRVGLIPW